ncbi:MAG: nucleotide exchange factor GrpE [Candidatus Bathyarchaeota archaeon]|nr:nucleotide exchange factor GrpE [Candidatus Bathyarchaeota archaeon]
MNSEKLLSKTPDVSDVSLPPQNKASSETATKEIESLKKALDEEKARSADCLNRLKYFQADLENLQKRAKKDTEEIVARANQQLISKLLVIVDDMEAATKATSGDGKSEALRSGFVLILDKLRSILVNEGLERIEAVGRHFDPAAHEAANKVLREDLPDGTVVEEIRRTPNRRLSCH